MDGIVISCSSTTSSHKNIIHNHTTTSHHQAALALVNKNEHNVEEIGFDHDRNASPDMDMHIMGGRINPMFIPSIISHVASFLPCADLKRCRFLNKQWDEECSKHIRKKGLVKLSSKSSIDNFRTQFLHKPNFFQNFSFEMTSKGIEIEIDEFFDTFGPHVKCFKLDFSGEHHAFTEERLYNLLFTKLSNLKELSLVGYISEDDHFLPEGKRSSAAVKDNQSSTVAQNSPINNNISNKDTEISKETNEVPTLPLLKYLEIFLYNTSGKDVSKHQFLIQLLSCVPNMEKISVPKVPKMLSFGMPLLHTLITTRELQFKKLQHLDMDIALYNGHIDVLKSKRYPLKYLNAEINSAVSDESLYSLLETYGKTLEVLQLKFPKSIVAYSEFGSATSFQVLKHLKLHGYKGPLTFLEQLKDLQSLDLIDNSFTAAMNREGFSSPLKVQLNYKMIWTDWLEEEYAFDCVNSSDAQLLRLFSNCFPNLASLNLPHLNDNDLRIIYQTFSHSLQELTMEDPLCTDYGLTGMDTDELCNADNSGNSSEHHLRQPFIGNLTRLRRLEISTSSNIDITDASVLCGIIYCESLKVLILRNIAITDVGLRTAVDSLNLVHLETTMCANIGGDGVKYVIEKMTERGMTFVWNKHQNRLTSCCVNRILSGNSQVTCIIP